MLRAGGRILIGSISESGSLTLRLIRVIGDVCTGKFDLGLLFLREIGGGRVRGERVEKVLFILLINGGWKRNEAGKYVITYGECLLGSRSERSW